MVRSRFDAHDDRLPSQAAGGARGPRVRTARRLSALGLLALCRELHPGCPHARQSVGRGQRKRARAEASADAGINLAVLELVAARESEPQRRRFPLNGTPATCRFDGNDMTLTIAVQDEAGKVD